MATKKFSELTTTSTPSSSALFAITDSSTSVAVTLANIAANMPDLTATTVTSSGTLNVSGNATFTGDVTISGDDLFMSTNTSGAALIADGTNFNPVVISGDIAIATNGAATIQTDAVEASMLNDNVISGQTELSSGVADADELLISDAGTLKRVGLDTAKSYFASTPTAITVADESSDTSCFPLFVTAATGDLGPKTASGLTFNSSTDVLSGTFSGNLTGNVTGNVSGTSGSTTGNAATATALQTARDIGGVSFDGTANINLPGVNTTGNQNTSGSSGSCTGNSATATTSTNVTVADESSDTTCFPLFVTAATGDLAPKSGSNLAFNSSSGVLTATGFAGDITGNVTGNASGSSGSCTGNSATATALETARNIGGVSFDGTGNIDLPGVNIAGNQNTSGTAAGLSATLATSSGGTGLTGNVVGKHSIYIPASAMYPNTTNGCAELTQVELSNGPELKVLDFDASSDENAQFTVCFPKLWNEGTVTFQAFFTVTGTNTGTVAWGLSAVAFADNDSINTAFGTNVVSTAKAHSGTSNDLDVAAESGAVTIAGSPSVNEAVFFQIMRDVSEDTQTGDARLIGIKLFFTSDALTDD